MSKIQLAVLSALSSGMCIAAPAHVHGQGEMLIAQEGQSWHIELRLPAANALGFEHDAQTSAEQQSVKNLAHQLEENAQVINLQGKCQLQSVSHSLFTDEHHDEDEHHHGHENEDHHSHDEGEHEHHEGTEHEHDEGSHRDVRVEYRFACNDALAGIELALFDSMPSLSVIQAQWVTDRGQGAAQLSTEQPELKW